MRSYKIPVSSISSDCLPVASAEADVRRLAEFSGMPNQTRYINPGGVTVLSPSIWHELEVEDGRDDFEQRTLVLLFHFCKAGALAFRTERNPMFMHEYDPSVFKYSF